MVVELAPKWTAMMKQCTVGDRIDKVTAEAKNCKAMNKSIC